MGLKSQLTDIRRFFKPYYILHNLSMLSYLYTRNMVYKIASPDGASLIAGWEYQVFTTLAITLGVKLIRCTSLDSFASDYFMFTKSCLLFMTYIIDKRVFAWYCIMFLMLFLMTNQPFYDGPEDMEYFTPNSFDETVKNYKDPEKRYLVEFYASWSPPCIHLEPILSQLSVDFSSDKLAFGKMDLGRWPLAAKEFKINIGGTSKQLPTLILFEAGTEIGRIPHLYGDGQVAKGRYRREDIIKAFELEGKKSRRPRPAIPKKTKKAKKDE